MTDTASPAIAPAAIAAAEIAPVEIAPVEIAKVAQQTYLANNALSLASSGGVYSPWVLGVYFASEELRLFAFLERSGKTMDNLLHNSRVAFCVSQNDAQQDFVQGIGNVVFLPDNSERSVRQLLEKKMPWLFLRLLGSGFPVNRSSLLSVPHHRARGEWHRPGVAWGPGPRCERRPIAPMLSAPRVERRLPP